MAENIKIRCAECAYARQDINASDRRWEAYECGNPDSEYYKALLNVTPGGYAQEKISWGGCAYGERRCYV